MSILQSKTLITFDINTREIRFIRDENISDYDTDVANIFFQAKYIDANGETVYLSKNELKTYECFLFAMKPVTNDFIEIKGVIASEVISGVEENAGIIKFTIPKKYTNRAGKVKCELHVKKINELIASTRFVYDVFQSLVTEFNDNLLDDADFPILQQLIADIQKVNNINDDKASLTTTYSSVKVEATAATLNKQITNVAEVLFNRGLISHKLQRPMVTFIDDDANPTFYNQIFPLVKTYSIPFTSAVITSRVDKETRCMTSEQLKEISEAGVELICHTNTHPQFNELTDAQIEEECEISKKWLNDRGYEGNILAYAFGSPSYKTRKIVRQYFDCAFDVAKGTTTGLLTPPLNTFNLQRTRFNEAGVDQDLATLKAHVDNAIANKCWIVFIIHSHYDKFSKTVLEQLIQYCKSVDIDIVNTRQGLNAIGNLIDIGDMAADEYYYILDCNGNIHGYSAMAQKTPSDKEASITASTPPSYFPQDTVTITRVNTANATAGKFPQNRGGILKTYTMNNDIYAYQEYKTVGDDNMYFRSWDTTTSTWLDWERVVTTPSAAIHTRLDIDSGTIDAGGKYQLDTTIKGINSSANVIATAISSLNGLTLQAYSYQNDTLRIVLHNPTTSSKSFTGKINIYAIITK